MHRSRSARGAALAGVLLLCLQACVEPAPPPPTQLPPIDASFEDCASACDGLRARGCAAGEPDEEGTSCEVVCADAEDFRPGLFLTAASRECVVNR